MAFHVVLQEILIGTNIHITGMLTHRTELITSAQPGRNIDAQVSPGASVCCKTN